MTYAQDLSIPCFVLAAIGFAWMGVDWLRTRRARAARQRSMAAHPAGRGR